MITIGAGFLIVFILLVAYVYNPNKRPFLTESDWTTHKSPWWQLYYSSKYLCPVRKPARGSELEKLFVSDMGPDSNSQELNNEKEVIIKAVGDLMCRRDLVGKGGETLWDQIGEHVFSGDLRMANMEFAVNPAWRIEKLLRYSVPESYAAPLLGDKRFGRFDCVFLANNHINDSLSAGIVSTCDFLDKMNVSFVGANRTKQESEKFPIFNCNGLKIAVLSYTFSTNGILLEPGFEHGTNLVRFNALKDDDYDPSIIYNHVDSAKKQGADIIIASNHWGVEFEYYPPERIVRRAHDLCECGIDLIIGHHPHIINMSERYRTSDNREAVILYSLGNITSWGLKFTMQKVSEVAEIRIKTGLDSENNKVTRIGEVTLMPVLHTMNKNGGVKYHRLIPVLSTVKKIRSGEKTEYLSAKDKMMLFSAYKEYNKHLIQKGFKYI